MFVERFMAWADEACAIERAAAVEELARHYVGQNIADEDIAATEQVFTILLNDDACAVRLAMAQRLSPCPFTPRVIIFSLAHDIADIASAVYAAAPHFSPQELALAISHPDPSVRLAIANRKELEAPTVRAICEDGCRETVVALLDNPMVRLGPHFMHDIALRLGSDAAIRDRLSACDDILPVTRQQLAHNLAQSLTGSTGLIRLCEAGRLGHAALDACNRATVEIAAACDEAAMYTYVEHLCASGQLTPALLARSICDGELSLFVHALANLTGSSVKRVSAIISDARIPAFQALYKASGLPQGAYGVFVAAIVSINTDASMNMVLEDVMEAVADDDTVSGDVLALLGRMAAERGRATARATSLEQPAELFLEAA